MGKSPLHHAAEAGSVKVVKALLAAGAPASPADNFHHTPLHYSKLNNHLDVSNLLSSRGADITLRYLMGTQTSIREAYNSLHVLQYQSESSSSVSLGTSCFFLFVLFLFILIHKEHCIPSHCFYRCNVWRFGKHVHSSFN